jgi:hypothetical protein
VNSLDDAVRVLWIGIGVREKISTEIKLKTMSRDTRKTLVSTMNMMNWYAAVAANAERGASTTRDMQYASKVPAIPWSTRINHFWKVVIKLTIDVRREVTYQNSQPVELVR